MRPRSALRKYQRYAEQRVKKDAEIFLGMDMGLGKTAAVLTALVDMLAAGTVDKALVVAPLRVAENTWPDEIGEWEHLQGLEFSVLTGSPSERALAATSPAPLHIINRENVRWLVEYWGKAWPYDMLIYDEASRLKAGSKKTGGGLEGKTKCWRLGDGWGTMNDKKLAALLALIDNAVCDPVEGLTTQETAERADVGPHFVRQLATDGAIEEHVRIRPPSPPQLSEFGALCKARSRIKRVVALSGTPAPNGEEDLWGPMYLVDRGRRLGATKTAFHRRWFVRHPSGFGYVPKSGAGEDIMHLLSDCMVALKKEDYLEVPKTIHNIITVDLSEKHRKQYKDFKEKLYAEEYDVEAVNKGVLIGKLLQFANGSMYRNNDNTKEVVFVHDEKLKALESVIEESGANQVLVAYSFRFDLERILKKYPKAVVFEDEPDFVRKWNEKKIGIGLAHPASIGHGLNLQKGGHIAVWYGLPWSLELYQQFNQRLPRSGQENTVVLHHILARQTEDESVYRALNSKGATQDRLMSLVTIRPDDIT